MNDDLGDVGLEALEALEAQDRQEQENSEPETREEKDASETGGQDTAPEDTGDSKKNEPDNDSEEDAGEDGEEGENSSEEEDNSDDKSDKKEENEEMSDEEFEKLAQKRGYTKAKSKEEPKADDDTKSVMDKLLARPDEVAEKVWDSLPEKNKVIYNSLPYIVAEGKKGTIQVKTAGQLPEDFEFRNQKAMMNFQNDLQAQEIRAEKMMEAIDAHAERERISKAQDAEAKMVIGEIESLQKSGDLPSPKVKYGEKGFDDDPAVLAINNVLNYRAMRARQGTNLSVRDSLLIYKAEHPEEFVKKEARGDAERRNIAKKVAGNSKATSSAVNGGEEDKPNYYRPGMSTEDVLDAVLSDMD